MSPNPHLDPKIPCTTNASGTPADVLRRARTQPWPEAPGGPDGAGPNSRNTGGRRWWRSLAGVVIAAGIFSSGIVIGHYHLFPLPQIQRLMRAISPQTPHRDVASKQPDPDWARMVSHFNGLPGKPDVVMVGDSLTEEAEWQEFFPELRIANRGIAGDTAAGVLARIEEIKQRSPRLVFVMIGVNDCFRGRSVDDVFADYVRIVEDLHGGGTTVVVQSTLYVAEDAAQRYPLVQYGQAAVVNARVSDLDRRLKEYCSESDVAYLDLNHTLAPGGTLDLGITTDGIHLSVQGYAIWVGQIRKWMKG